MRTIFYVTVENARGTCVVKTNKVGMCNNCDHITCHIEHERKREAVELAIKYGVRMVDWGVDWGSEHPIKLHIPLSQIVEINTANE